MYEHFTRQQQQFDVRRGDVYYINNNRGQRGNEIRKDRPAVIVSADFLNKHSGDVVVVFLTSQPKKDMQTHVTIRTTGRVSEALCEQPTTVSVERLNNRIGSVTDREMQQIDIALQIALKLDAGADTKEYVENQSGGGNTQRRYSG
jgi:mRNA interferase MazF